MDCFTMKYGYARVSTKEQNLDLQIDALRKVGCQKIFHEVGPAGAFEQKLTVLNSI